MDTILSRRHSTPPRETRKHSQNASPKEPKGSETVPWTCRILQKISPQICRHFKSSNTLNKKGRGIQMDTRVREMFSDIKGILETGTDTQIPRPQASYTLYTDAPKYAYTGVLTQHNDGVDHPITYISGLFCGSQLNWATLTKEAYAIYMSIKKLNFYIDMAKITVRSDHLPLKKFLEQKTMNSKVNNWGVNSNHKTSLLSTSPE